MTLRATLRWTGCGLLGHEDRAHAALADLLQQLVRADHACRHDSPGRTAARSAPGAAIERPRGSWGHGGPVQETAGPLVGVEQGLDLPGARVPHGRPRPGTRTGPRGRRAPGRGGRCRWRRGSRWPCRIRGRGRPSPLSARGEAELHRKNVRAVSSSRDLSVEPGAGVGPDAGRRPGGRGRGPPRPPGATARRSSGA